MSTYFCHDPHAPATPLWPVDKDQLEAWLQTPPPGAPVQAHAWAKAVSFEPGPGKTLMVPDPDGGLAGVLLCLGDDHELWAYAAAAQGLPPGVFRLAVDLPPASANAAALGWALGAYAFGRYQSKPANPRPQLIPPAGADLAEIERATQAIYLVRDLVNTPAQEMGPAELAEAALEVFAGQGGRGRVLVGEELLEANYPGVYRVGQGADRPPRLIDLTWGQPDAPRLTLVGKGVCFDSGGLNLKPADGMKNMKGDMAGAAISLGLAAMIMGAGLRVRLRVLIPAVENLPSGRAYRPGDVIVTRQGLRVEIANTDAEGRVILADPLAEAAGEKPDLLIDFATLTGAARVALGPSLPAAFARQEELAWRLCRLGREVGDPVWPLPLWRPYRKYLDSDLADLRNAHPELPLAGAITAALFLGEFVGPEQPWLHLDLASASPKPELGRPKGADAFGLRAAYALIAERFGA